MMRRFILKNYLKQKKDMEVDGNGSTSVVHVINRTQTFNHCKFQIFTVFRAGVPDATYLRRFALQGKFCLGIDIKCP